MVMVLVMVMIERSITWGGCSRSAHIADAGRWSTAWLVFDELSHGSVHARLDVAPGAHVFGLLLAPHHLGVGVLHHYLHTSRTSSSEHNHAAQQGYTGTHAGQGSAVQSNAMHVDVKYRASHRYAQLMECDATQSVVTQRDAVQLNAICMLYAVSCWPGAFSQQRATSS